MRAAVVGDIVAAVPSAQRTVLYSHSRFARPANPRTLLAKDFITSRLNQLSHATVLESQRPCSLRVTFP